VAAPEHQVIITCNGRRLREPNESSIDLDILQPADAFSLTFPLDLQTWEACPLDGEIEIRIDGTLVCSGFIDSVKDSGNGSFTVDGRDRTGRLVDESIDGTGLAVNGRSVGDVVAGIIDPIFSGVTFSNAENRRLMLGRGKKPRTGTEPALLLSERLATVQRIEAGVTKWEAITRLLRPLQLLAWGSASGRELVLARPNYEQEPLFTLYETPSGSNVKSMQLARSNMNRYSKIEVSGSGFPPGISPPPRVPTYPGERVPPYVSTNRIGVAFDQVTDARDGVGGDFQRQKRLFVLSESRTTEEAQIEADRILARGLAHSRTVQVTMPGLGQRVGGAAAYTTFAPDVVVQLIKEIEAAPGDDTPAEILNAPFYCTRVHFRRSRSDEQTDLSFVPLGTLLI
jgi:prophage tail gpP-like protein